MKNIVLTGLSGSGKTTLAALLAKELGLRLIDMDAQIEAEAGMPIKEIFSIHGEGRFRDLETATARSAGAADGAVIATGGGIVLREENMRALRENGVVVFLDRKPEIILRDIACEGRPLLADGAERLIAMAEERRARYVSTADIIFPNNGPVEKALAALLAGLRFELLEDGFAVIGDPIAHTLSPVIHSAVFAAAGVPYRYEAVHVPRGKLPQWVERVRKTRIRGFNVTIPHKRDILPLLDEIDEESRLSGAVNTVVVKDGRLYGYNTDMPGLLLSLQNRGYGFNGRSVVILGTGGVAGSVALKAAREGAREVSLLGRRPDKAEEICGRVRQIAAASMRADDFQPPTVTAYARGADLLINATPLGMHGIPEDFEDLSFLAALPAHALVCDLIYNPPRTRLLREAEKRGLQIQNGLGMLIYQAIIADEHYLGRALDRKALYQTVSQKIL